MAGLYQTCADYLEAIKREFVLDEAATPYTVWPNADRIGAINEARNIIAAEMFCLPTTNTITTIAGTAAYDLATSRSTKLVYVDEVYYASRKLYRTTNYGDIVPGTANGTPLAYYVDPQNKYLYLSPPPATVKTVLCRTFSEPSEMTAGGDAEVIPHQFRDMVVSYALAKGFDRDGISDGVSRSGEFKTEFNEQFKRALKWKRVM